MQLIMWTDTNIDIKGDYVTRSAGTALLCNILTQRLSDRRPELQPLSETLCWIILPIVFKVAAAGKGAKHRQEKGDVIGWNVSKRLPASTLSLWVVALCLVIYWFSAAENALVAYIPALMPLLLVSQNHLIWHDADVSGTSLLGSQPFFYLLNTAWGGFLVACFSILTLKSGWHVRASDALSLVPVAAMLVVYITVDPRPRISNRYYRLLPPFDFEDVSGSLSLRATFVLGIVLGLETLAFGVPVFSAFTPVLALTKALSWYFTVQTVCLSPRNLYRVIILNIYLGAILVLAYCRSYDDI